MATVIIMVNIIIFTRRHESRHHAYQYDIDTPRLRRFFTKRSYETSSECRYVIGRRLQRTPRVTINHRLVNVHRCYGDDRRHTSRLSYDGADTLVIGANINVGRRLRATVGAVEK